MKLLLKKEKGVSEVIGTLLILAITVTLFSSVFYYVSTIPTPTPQVYSSFSYNYNINTNSTLNLTITNTGGQALMLSSTQLMIVLQNNTGSKVITHMLSEKNFSSQISSSYFGVGKSFTYHSWWDNVKGITFLTTIYVYLIDKQNSQIVWYTVLQGSLPTVKVVGFSYSPSPIKANTTQTVNFNAYVIYNQNNKVFPNVTLTIVGALKNLKLLYSSPMNFANNTILKNLKPGIYNVYVNASLNNSVSTYKGIINVVSGYSSTVLEITSISFTNQNPVHGSNNGITVTVYSTSPNTETFYLTYYDTFRGIVNKMNISTGNPSPYFTIAPYTSMVITATWLNVGGSGAAAGVHTITVNISLSPNSPPVTVQGLSTNITVMPKILLIDDENVPVNSPSSVFNFYTSMLLYINYPVDTEIVGYNQLASTSGYDLVIWITGYSSQGLSQNQANQIIGLANSGVSILLISSSPSSYSYLSSSGWFNQYTYTSLNNGSMYFTKIGSYNMNINGTLTPSSYGNNVIYFYSSFTTLSYYKNNVNVTGIYSKLSSGARVVILGFEFSRLYVYQQDLIMNKIMLWLSNITIRTGNDLALLDMKISNPNPLFSQPVNLTFYVANFSPVNLTNIDLEVLIDNQPINGQPLYHINFIPGNGSYVTVNVSWTAGSPGQHTIYAYVNPYHTISEVNYNNNALPPVVLNVINVKFSTLVVWIHGSNDKNYNITSVTNALSNLGVSYVFLNYNVSKSNLPSLTNPSSTYYFMNYNLVILDFNSTQYSLDTNLANGIIGYLTNKNITKFPYSLLFLGEYAGYAINSNSAIQNYLYLNNIGLTSISGTVKSNTYLYGNNTNNQNLNLGFFGTNVTRGYGIVYKFNKEITTLTCTNPYSINILMNSSKSYGVLENISYLMVGIIPLSLENIAGIIQNHTTNTPYSPSSSSSTILTYSPPSSARYAQNLLMLNFLLSFKYVINNPIPEILGCDINVSSQYVTLNNYYLINGIVRNLGYVGVNVVLQSYEEQSLFNTQSIYLPPFSAVKFQVLWKPTYASSPSPEILRFVLVGNFQKLPMQEALIFQKVYFLYNNGSTLQNWNHYNVLQYISGEALFGLTGSPVQSDISTSFNKIINITDSNSNSYYNPFLKTYTKYPPNGWVSNFSFSYPNSYYIRDVIDTSSTKSGYMGVELMLAPVHVSPGEIVTLSWEWKYSIAMAQNGLFLMVQIGNTWYQVALPYNSNPDLGNILTINNCKIVEAYNGQSGGGTYSWTYHSINTNELYVMDPTTGIPMPNPMNVTGQTLTFMFVYIAPAYYASTSAGSSQPGAGTYIDNVMLTATNGGNDGWRVIHPGETSNQYGISTNGISYLGFQGAPTYSLIALYNNYQGYPTFANSLWDNLVTPVIDLYNALNATLNFTFKANIAQGLYGAGWPGDYFSISVSTNGGSTWSQVYSPPTYPSGGQYSNGGQSGGGTIYATNTSKLTFYPANGANSTYWLTITINLNFYLGLPIYIDFAMVTNNGWGYSNIFTPWHAVGYNNANANPFFGLYLTNIYVQGFSQTPPIFYSGVWT